MLTSPGFSSGIQQRQSAGWGQGFAFPGPPRMTIEPPQDQARESNITVEGARINLPSIPTPNISINSNPTYSSPVYDFSSNYGSPLNLAFENQMNLQQVQQDLQTYVFSNDLEGRIAALEAWRQTGIDWTCDAGNELIVLRDWEFDSVNNKIINTYRALTIVDGLVVGQDCSVPDGETNVTTCP